MEKNYQKQIPINRFWGLLANYKKELRQIYLYAIFIGLVNLSLPLGIQAIITYIQSGEFTSSWVILIGVVLAGIAINGFLQIFQIRIVENMQQSIFARSALEFSQRLPKINYKILDGVHPPELANRFFDTLTIQKGLPKILIDLSMVTFQMFFGLILLGIYSAYFMALGAFIIVLLWLIYIITGKKGLKTSLMESKYKYKLVHWLEEIARVNKSFKTNPNSILHIEKADAIAAGYVKHRESHFQVLLSQFKSFVIIKVIIAASFLILGGSLVINEQLNIGQFVAAEIIILLIIASVEKLLTTIDVVYDVMTGLEKIGYVADLEMDSNTGNLPLDKSEALSVRAEKMTFTHYNSTKTLFDKLSFNIEKGEKVMLCGKTGSGKSTLLQLISGTLNVTEGQILINDTPLVNFNQNELYSAVSIIFPANQLFDGSLRDNLTMGRDYSDKQIFDVLDVLKLTSYVSKLPNSLDTYIESEGNRLARSVVQKMHIARVLLKQPKLLIIEDPLQFVEEEEKEHIIDYLMSPERNWTVVLISDYPYWKEKVTQIIDLSDA